MSIDNWPRISSFILRQLPSGDQVLRNIAIVQTPWASDEGQCVHNIHVADDGAITYEVWRLVPGTEAVRIYPPEPLATASPLADLAAQEEPRAAATT